MAKRVLIVGGGVGGMSAAHELVERGFEVVVLERKQIPGGKARSIDVPGSASGGRRPLPGEHGFRFFPGFYRHLPDTMKRIPFGDHKSVFDNLVAVEREIMASEGRPWIMALAGFPTSWKELMIALAMPGEFEKLGLTAGDMEYYATKLWQIMTSCDSRRITDYERLSWWAYLDAANRSKAFQQILAIGITRNLVASKAELANTRTVGEISCQLMFDMVEPGKSADRVLNGPTNDVWINPWLAYLEQRGVTYHRGALVDEITCVGGKITGVKVRGVAEPYTADYYVCALPVEQMAHHLSPAMLAADPTLQGILVLQKQVNWMNGIQFYLKDDVPICPGHQDYLDSPWALTSVSQRQFWPRFDPANYGDGTVKGVLSVDISDWNTVGHNGKTAWDCTKEEIAAEVWDELKRALNVGGQVLLRDENLHPTVQWFLDPDIEPGREHLIPRNKQLMTNAEPLLVNQIDSWNNRPDAYTRIPNLFLASDYVRTNTNLATMEAANEAARRAVNNILGVAGSSADLCKVWPLPEPEILAPLKWLDQHRWEQGLPWTNVVANDLEKLERPVHWLEKIKKSVAHLLG